MPYAEYTTSFALQVPYETSSWQGGVNLTKENSSVLQKEVFYIYDKVRKMWSDKNLAGIFEYNKKGYTASAQSQYRDINTWKKYTDDMIKIVNNKDFKMEPLENYILKFYGNGKIVALQRIDLWNRNRSVLLKNYTTQDGEGNTQTDNLYLYRPSKTAPLEPIR